jgi:hypothetical protein
MKMDVKRSRSASIIGTYHIILEGLNFGATEIKSQELGGGKRTLRLVGRLSYYIYILITAWLANST